MAISKIRKKGPFELSKIKLEHPHFSHLLATAALQIEELPDFSDDSKIAVMSDFSGEHTGARFATYSFLILAYDKIGPFLIEVERLRKKHGLFVPYSEFAFKDLAYGPRSRALKEFLTLVDNLIHGAVITIAVDKEIGSVFGASKKQTFAAIEAQLNDLGLGTWKGATAEKALRVCHAMAFFIGLTTQAGQRLLWYCDKDAINEDTKCRSFSDTQKIFSHTLGMYANHSFDLLGFGKSFDDKSHLDDLLSIPDFAAGIVQDLLHAHKTGNDNIPGGDEKEALLRWIAKPSKFLSKITIQISQLPDGTLGGGLVSITPAK